MRNRVLLWFSVAFHIAIVFIPDVVPPSYAEDKINLVFVEGGCFQMGDIFRNGEKDEFPPHKACVDDYYIGEHEVTQGQWTQIMRRNPADFKSGDDYPVELVTWGEVQKFIKGLSKNNGIEYRLPTEAEWEYAAREGGKAVLFGTGKNTINSDQANFNARRKYVKPYSKAGEYRKKSMPVKSFPPNALGLYDMSGNVWEWCNDWYDEKYYSVSPVENPPGPESGLTKILRGGSWYSGPQNQRASLRSWAKPIKRSNSLGLRLASSTGRRFIFSEYTATDKKTGLVWTKNAFLAGSKTNWHETKNLIDKLNSVKYAGFKDWRVPSKDDLLSLDRFAETFEISEKIDEYLNGLGFSNIKPIHYWSSSGYKKLGGNVWIIDVSSGDRDRSNMSVNSLHGFWPVRSETH